MTQKRRVESALAWAQKRLGTSYHLIVGPMPPDKIGDNTVMATGQTARGDEDPNAFLIVFSPQVVKAHTMPDLRKIAMHEILHCLLWRCTRRAKREDEEAAVYILQRALVGEMKP